jgi:hypothetical protein
MSTGSKVGSKVCGDSVWSPLFEYPFVLMIGYMVPVQDLIEEERIGGIGRYRPPHLPGAAGSNTLAVPLADR